MDDRPPLSAGPEAIAHDLGNALMALLGDVERLSAAADSAIGARALAGVRHCVALCRGMRAGATSTDQAKLKLPLDESIQVSPDLPRTDLLALDLALSELARRRPEDARIVEMRFFAGLTEAEIAAVLGIGERSVQRRWRYAQIWLYRRLADGTGRVE